MLKVPLIYINGIRIVQRLVPNRCTSQMRLITRTSNNRYRRWTRRWKHGGWNAIARGGVGAVVIEPWTVARPVSFRFLSFLPPSTFRRAEIMGCENRKDREKYLSAKNVSLTRFASRLSEISFRILGNFRSNRMQMNQVISFLLVYVRTALFLAHFNSARIPEFNRDNRHHAPHFLRKSWEQESSPRDPLYHFSPSAKSRPDTDQDPND